MEKTLVMVSVWVKDGMVGVTVRVMSCAFTEIPVENIFKNNIISSEITRVNKTVM